MVATKSAEVAPGNTEEAIYLTFGTEEDAAYRIFVVDRQYEPLLDAYDIGG